MKHHHPRAYRSKAMQLAHFRAMLAICEARGWLALAELIQEKIDELE